MSILNNFMSLIRKINHRSEISYDFSFNSDKSKRNILIFVENINATYYLSFHYVLQLLHQKDELNFFVISSPTITKYLEQDNQNPEELISNILTKIQPHIVIFSRYGLPFGKIFQQKCQEKKIPTIYHIDDDLLNIPLSLGKGIQKQHGSQEVIHQREYLLKNVDLIYASTPYLGKTLANRFPQQKVYYGIYAPYLDFLISKTQLDSKFQETDTLTIGYMGSKGHQEDLKMITPAIAQILADYPHIKFETFGTIAMPDELKSFGERIISHKVNVNYEQFLQTLYNLRWNIGLAPLQNTEFNNCKAPTKFIEYTSCEIPTIASNVGVYNQFTDEQQIILAESDDWYSKLRLLIKNPDLRKSLLTNAKARCSQEFSMEVLEKQIMTVIKNVNLMIN